MRKLNKKEFVELLNIKAPNKNYIVIGDYVNSREKILVENKYGKCLVFPNSLLKDKNPTITTAVDVNNYFINQAREVHGELYDYTKFDRTSNYTKSTIICKTHGEFEQNANNHLNGQGCPTCGIYKRGYSKTDFSNFAEGKVCTLYIINMYNEVENFYKIGITTKSIERRFKNKTLMPYNYKILHYQEGSAGDTWEKEMELKRKLKDFSYVPNIYFHGKTECFNVNPIEFL